MLLLQAIGRISARYTGSLAIRMSLLRLTLFTLVLGTLGCSQDPEVCPRVAGQFQPLYTPLAVTTPSPVPYCSQGPDLLRVDIDDTPKPVQTNVVTLSTGRLTTEVVRRGCTVQMSQLFESPGPGQPQLYLSATDLVVHSATEMSGPISMTRYSADGNIACWAPYHARLVKGSDAVGAAVGQAVAAPAAGPATGAGGVGVR